MGKVSVRVLFATLYMLKGKKVLTIPLIGLVTHSYQAFYQLLLLLLVHLLLLHYISEGNVYYIIITL